MTKLTPGEIAHLVETQYLCATVVNAPRMALDMAVLIAEQAARIAELEKTLTALNDLCKRRGAGDTLESMEASYVLAKGAP